MVDRAGPGGSSGLRSLLHEALFLKRVPRKGWMRHRIRDPESVAAHSWGVAWLALVLCPPELDARRVLELAVIHDLPEARAGDVTPHDGVTPERKLALEQVALDEMLREVAGRERLEHLWREYHAQRTPESRFVRLCDKLDMALQSELYERECGADLEEFRGAARALVAGTDLEALLGPDPR